MNDEFIDADNPLVFHDEAEIKRKSKSSTEDAYSNEPQESVSLKRTITPQSDSYPQEAQDSVSVSQVLKEQVGEVQDNLDLTVNRHINENADLSIGDDVVMLRHHHETGVPPRLDASKIETEEQALDYFYNEVLRRFRFNRYDMMIDAPTNRLEVEDALFDALSDLNNYFAPHTRWSLLDMVKKTHRYRRLFILMCGKNLLFTLWSESNINEIEVSIEDFSLEPRTSNIKDMYDTVSEMIETMLQEMKSYDRLTAKISHFNTGKRRYSAGYNSFSVRTNRIIRNGGLLG